MERFRQLRKADFLMNFKLSGMLIDRSLVHPEKADAGISSKPLGRLMDGSEEQFLNVYSPKVASWLFALNVTDCRLLHPAKASFPMLVIVEGNSTAVILVLL